MTIANVSHREFVGDLGLVAGGRDTELHVRYGVDSDGRYVEWSITVMMCRGGVDQIRASGGTRARAVVRRFRTARGRIVRQEFSPRGGAPRVIEVATHSGDPDEVNAYYDEALSTISRNYAAGGGPNPEPHRVATFGYAMVERSIAFHEERPYQTRTVVAVDSDTVDELIDRQGYYFRDTGNRIAAYSPESRLFLFPRADPSRPSTINTGERENAATGGPIEVQPTLTVGMLVDSVSQEDEWAIPRGWIL